MVGRFLNWSMASVTRWADSYMVTVRLANKRGTVKAHSWKFEDRADAVKCQQWWDELGHKAILKSLD